MANTPDEETKDRLLRGVKKEVKQIMEEAVTRKFVHEDSGSIISLCAAVEACLSHGLKRSLVSILKGGNTTVSLLKQVAKGYPPAGEVITKVQEIESRLEANKKSMNGDSPNKPQYSIRAALQQRHLWIRVALFEKHLAKIVEHLHENCGKYYEKEAYLADPVHGPILASLLVGPCALDYSKMKTADHYWTDPPADELVQRHRIHSNALASGANSPRRPGLQVKKTTGNTDEHRTAVSARDYVESLHQNSRSQLLYGKNNVLVQPKEDAEQIPGYLSLHQTLEHLTIKWTPNQLMNGAAMEEAEEETDKSIYWDYALTVNLEDIVYLHCHQQPDCGGTLVLVGQDGVQYPPIHFPCGGHLLAFLTCLENGLLPRGLLDPPLWLQRGKGKVLPKLKRKSSAQQLNPGGSESTSPKEGTQIFEGEEATDYVFRIISAFKPDIDHDEAILHSPPKFTNFPWSLKDFGPRHQLIRQNLVQSLHSPKSVYAPLSPVNELSSPTPHHQWAEQGSSIKLLCDTMRKQIISRAFYGWLAHCRHLRTVRTHLSGLVHPEIIWSEQRQNEEQGMTEEKWRSLFQDDRVIDEKEVMRSIYFGGVQHEIRHEVWPYLLGHYQFGLTEKERNEIDESTRINFEQILAEWMAVETIINQRERDTQAAKVSSDNSSDLFDSGQIPLEGHDPSLDSEVFELEEDDEYVESGERLNDLNEEQREFVKKEDYVIIRCRSPRQDTLETETGRSLASEVSGDPPNDPLINGKGSPHGSDEGFGDSISVGESVDSSGHAGAPPQRQSVTESIKEEEGSEGSMTEGGKEKSEGNSGEVAGKGIDEVEGGVVGKEVGDEGSSDDTATVKNDDKISAIRVEMCNGHTISEDELEGEKVEIDDKSLNIPELSGHLTAETNTMSPASSNGGVYANDLLDSFSLNLHRIDKDVQRCDRNYFFFTTANLEKLRNVMCTYVWEHLDVGYVQGMCDLVAPLLVILEDEAKTYNCFCELMKRMCKNFPHGGAMDNHFANMRSLIQILDSEMFELMHQNGDYTHFYFCYRWFLLDFKRELVYDDTFSVWETIWTAKHCASANFVLFIALALVEYYRDIILDNNMDFTDIIKFFNEMAERHDAKAVLKIARELVHKVQTLIENK
ncbi:small G protein signaling modulator 1-like isoform X2 [Apostichopus japonicus]|uniref:small G protein signaling modulator 1-like isoform X2 n=1 Tax=Stichopus japonicus TaxID=307972 RepID=UPI003AB4474B